MNPVWLLVLAGALWLGLLAGCVLSLQRLRSIVALSERLRGALKGSPRAEVFRMFGAALGNELEEMLLEVQNEADLTRRERLLCGVRNWLVGDIAFQLQRQHALPRAAWRVSGALAVGVALTLAPTNVQSAALGAGIGLVFTALLLGIGRMADRVQRSAREHWNALIRVLEGTFTNG